MRFVILHPNNNFPLIKFYNYKISRDLEITFLNKKFVKYKKTTLPNKLDEPTVVAKKIQFYQNISINIFNFFLL